MEDQQRLPHPDPHDPSTPEARRETQHPPPARAPDAPDLSPPRNAGAHAPEDETVPAPESDFDPVPESSPNAPRPSHTELSHEAHPEPATLTGRGVTRRDFLRVAAWSAVGLLGSRLAGVERVAAATLQNFQLPPGLTPSFTTTLKRRDDLLDLRFEFYNLQLVTGIQSGESVLQRINANSAAYMVVIFPPQSIGERAFENNENPYAPLIGLDWSNAGSSRLAFQLPGQLSSIPFTTQSLLTWSSFTPRLVPAARPSGAPAPHPALRAPLAHETAIEMPWRLMLSPHADLGWAHATGLVTHNGRTEIWHTRLGRRIGGQIDEWNTNDRTVRAIWTRDITNPLHPILPLSSKATLTVNQRINIVRATADGSRGFTPTPVRVNRLMLSPLGGWLDVTGVWSDAHPLLAWRHLATMGRDHYVRVVDKGYLFPYGHAAALITISERRFENYNGQQGAFLRKEFFVAVRQPLKSYGSNLHPNNGRAWPFRSLRFTTLITPSLDPPGNNPSYGGAAGAFRVQVNNQPFPFHVTGKDWTGRDSDFMTPVIFVPSTAAFNANSMSAMIAHYMGENAEGALRRRELGGQTVAVAESAKAGDTDVELVDLILEAQVPANNATLQQLQNADQPRFFPALTAFGARLSAVEQTGAGALPPTRFNFGPYVSQGFGGSNTGQVFAQLIGAAQSAAFGADSGGGLITPDFDPKAISRILGAVGGDPLEIANAEFDPAKFFKAGAAKLLGGIDLAHIVQKVNNFLTHEEGAMKITTRPIQADPNDPLSPPIAIVTELVWKPDLQGDPLGLFEPDPGSLSIDAQFRQDLVNPDQSSYEIEGDLRDFKLNLIGNAMPFMILRFDRLYFHARSGQKTELKPLVDSIEFAGALEFVNKLKDFFTFGGSGPYIRPEPQGLLAGYDLPLPQIPLGMLMINDIALSASLFIPWSGAPARIRFGLSSREKPFNVTYSAIGGGGFFGIAFGLDGLEKFECALELGAYLSVDLGVVSGSLSIAAGIYFAIEKVQDNGEERLVVGLEAYIRFMGKVQALGIVSISLEIYLGLSFQTPPPKLRGIAKAELKIKVLIFSGSVKVTVKRTISATPNDPTFAHLFDVDHWQEYAAAFA